LGREILNYKKNGWRYLGESFYKGELVGNLAHGSGKLVNFDGEIYEGEWVNGKAQGFGRFSKRDGSYYEGQWLEDMQHG
jgi:hypothetical protein